MIIPRREAKKIIAAATRVRHFYRSLEPGVAHPWEESEIALEEFVRLFADHPRWRMNRRAAGGYDVSVPNIYGYEYYSVEGA